MNSQEYWAEIQSIANNLVDETMQETDNNRDEAEELINDSRLYETIDNHQWVIYCSYNLDVIKHSDNEDYYADNFGAESLAYSLEQGGLSNLHCHIAFWCMYADVQDYLDSAFDEYINNLQAV